MKLGLMLWTRRVRIALSGGLLALLSGCADDPKGSSEAFAWELPAGLPPPFVPTGSPMSVAKVELGRRLFYDRRLSRNEQMACATCHQQALAFSDGLERSLGTTGEELPRNAMGLTNVGYRSTLTWANPLLEDLENQALVPLLGEFPVELGVAGHEALVLGRIEEEAVYRELFPTAFPKATEHYTLTQVVEALAAFQRTLLSFDSPYDRFVAGEAEAISPSAQRGFALFFSERAECYHCHGGVDFTNATRTAEHPRGVRAFHNTGLYDIDGEGAYPANNAGLVEFTREPQDMGKFRVPTLRNVAVTAPYMHDGSIPTLEGVVAHYVAGGRAALPEADGGAGSPSPLADSLVFPLGLTTEEQADLVAFLESLTDEEFLTRPEISDPW